MAWNDNRFERVLNRIIEVTKRRGNPTDVPYFRFLYDPELELKCITECKRLTKRLRAKGISSEIISFAELTLESLDQLGCLENDMLNQEKEHRDWILNDLERELPNLIVEKLRNRLKERDISHCAILIRVGVLFPFVHISTILTLMEGFVKCTIVIPYPGNKQGEMLNYQGENIKNYYRGEIID